MKPDDFLILNRWPWYSRIPLKWAAFAVVCTFVCFPYPGRLIRHLRHWQNPDALVDAHAPALTPHLAVLRGQIRPETSPGEVHKAVQKYVLAQVKYQWDWNTWGLADYMPTAEEALEKGQEDCDGRAVVAASLLKGLGYDARIVTDFSHVWVRTEHGDLMGPGQETAVVATADGLKVHWSGVWQLPKALAYGVAVFPFWRELIILAAAWLLLRNPRCGRVMLAVSLAAVVTGLLLLREGSAEYLKPVPRLQWAGFIALLGGLVAVAVPMRRNGGTMSVQAVPA